MRHASAQPGKRVFSEEEKLMAIGLKNRGLRQVPVAAFLVGCRPFDVFNDDDIHRSFSRYYP